MSDGSPMTQAELASHVPGLTATIDELFAFVALVRECLAEHDAANGFLTGTKIPDSPITARIRVALDTLTQATRLASGPIGHPIGHWPIGKNRDRSQCLPPTF